MKFTLREYLDRDCTLEQWIEQHNPIKLEVGKVYRQHSDSWCEKHYKILFVDDNIAVGVVVYNQISNKFIGDYELFYSGNGFKHTDICRPEYRLTEEIKL